MTVQGTLLRVVWAASLMGLFAANGVAQESAQYASAAREPVVYYAPARAGSTRVDARNAAVLRRRVTIDVTGVSLASVLDEITRQTGLRFSYSPEVASADRRVTLSAKGLTVLATLTEILLDTGLDVELDPLGEQATLVRHVAVTSPASVEHRQQAAAVITGRVTEAKTGQPLPYASVLLDGTSHGATASDSGTYRIPNVASGTYTLIARILGYVPSRKSVTVTGDQAVTVDVALEKSPNQLQQVVTTGTLVPTEVKAVPTPITVISDSDIARQQPRTINEVIQQSVPTAVAFTTFQNPSETYMSVRGATELNGGGTQLETFVDGVEVAENGASPVDPTSIDHIEVIRGPEAAAIYGSGAIDGVIEIFTKHGEETQGRPSVDLQAAAADVQTPYPGFRGVLRQTYSGDVRGGTQDAGYTLGGGYTETNNYLPFGAYSAQSTPSAYAGIHYSRGVTTLDISGRYHISDAPGSFNPLLTTTEPPNGPFSVPLYQTSQVTNATLGASLGVQPESWWRNTFTIGYDENNTNQTQNRPRLTSPSDTELTYSYSNDNRISLRYMSSLTGRLGSAVSGTLIVGADYWAESELSTNSSGVLNTTGQIVTDPNQPFNTTRYLPDNTGLFAQAQLDLFEQLFLTAGLRADWDTDFGDSIGTAISPRLGLAYSHALGFTTLKLRASWGSAILPPYSGAKELIVQSSSIQLASPHLGPERQHGGDGGFDILFGNIGSFSATYYDQTAYNLIQQVQLPSDSIPTYQAQTVGTVHNTGIELEGTFGIGRLSLRAMYGYARARVDELAPGYTGDYHVGDQTFDTPKNNGGATLALRLWHGTSIAAGLTYIGSWADYNEIKEFGCLVGLQSGSTSSCPPAVIAGLGKGEFLTRPFLIQYPNLVLGHVGATQVISPLVSAFISIDNIGDNEGYQGNNLGPQVGRISTFGLRVHY